MEKTLFEQELKEMVGRAREQREISKQEALEEMPVICDYAWRCEVSDCPHRKAHKRSETCPKKCGMCEKTRVLDWQNQPFVTCIPVDDAKGQGESRKLNKLATEDLED